MLPWVVINKNQGKWIVLYLKEWFRDNLPEASLYRKLEKLCGVDTL